jgi:hypothetical protein
LSPSFSNVDDTVSLHLRSQVFSGKRLAAATARTLNTALSLPTIIGSLYKRAASVTGPGQGNRRIPSWSWKPMNFKVIEEKGGVAATTWLIGK